MVLTADGGIISPPHLLVVISYNVSSIYDVATAGSNVPKGKGEARSVYAVLSAVAGIFTLNPITLLLEF